MLKVRLLTGVLAFSCFAETTAPPVIPDTVSVQRGISYDQYPQTVLDIYQPKALPKGRRPGVLVIHGGGWTEGSKDAVVEKFVLPWVAQGFVVANVEYRLAGVAPAPAAVSDVLKAADWFRRNGNRWNVDTRHIVATGGSAGGHLALMAGMTPKKAHLGPTHKVAAVINFYGITDVEDQLQGEHMQGYAVTWVPEQEGRFELARRLSPMTYIRKDVPPILTIHGNADETVPYEHGVSLTKALRDVGGDAEMINVPYGAHGFPMEKMNELYVQVFQFLKKRRIMK
jgi:acetyl esterase/lipase